MKSRAQVALSVLTLIAFLNKVLASDGCGWVNWRCGDICIPRSKPTLHIPCHCGGDKILSEVGMNKEWCCSEKPCIGLGEWKQTDVDQPAFGSGWSEGGNCSSGKVLSLTQPCDGKCNDNRKDIVQDDRSYIPCPPVTKNANVTQCIHQSEKNDNQFTCLNSQQG